MTLPIPISWKVIFTIKSIKYTADRYDGAIYINTENNWFDIKIAIPKKS